MIELLTLSSSLEFEQITNLELSLVVFGTPWSYPCRIQHKILVNFMRNHSGLLSIARVDVESHQEIARTCKIQTVPTLIMYRRTREIKRSVGIQSREALAEFIQMSL